MFKLHLILKYLRKRRIAWVSLVAVTLCTAMVLVVISIMGGWLNMFLNTAHGLSGDIIITSTREAAGFGHYDEILDAVRRLPQVKTAIPAITTYGIANIGVPNDIDDEYEVPVTVKAFGDLAEAGEVNSFPRSLYRQYISPAKDINNDPSLSGSEKQKRLAALDAKPPTYDKPLDAQTYRNAFNNKGKFDNSTLPGIIVSTPVILKKGRDGSYVRPDYIYQAYVKLSVGDITTADNATPSLTREMYWIVDDCHTGFYPVDANTVYVPFESLQKAVNMTPVKYDEIVDGKTVEHETPPRVTEIEVKLKDGASMKEAIEAIDSAANGVQSQYDTFSRALLVESWDHKYGPYIDAVVHEKVLMTFLFGIISIVAVFLVFCIFYMIVAEKTRDIGIVKSLGATNAGVAQIFLGYGLAIGLLGAGTGLLFAYLIVHNINALHAWMGREMGVVIWDPQTYIFDTIPNTMQMHDVVWIVSVAILSALAGAMVPAFRASRMNPVEALRWE